jgi:hypothetical protein
MSYYTDLKQYDEILFMYHRTQSISRNKGEDVRQLLNLYETETGKPDNKKLLSTKGTIYQ